MQAKYQALRAQGKLHDTIEEWLEKRRQRDALAEPPRLQPRLATIELPVAMEREVMAEARTRHPRRQNWDRPEADTESKTVVIRTIDHGQYSRRCTWRHYSYQPVIRCCGTCSPGWLLWFHGAEHTWIRAPKGWQFGRDDLGLYIVRRGEKRIPYRYHFGGDDLRNRATLRRAAIEHIDRQRSIERSTRRDARLRRRAEAVGVYVTIRDSVAAGNCPAGTRRWAEDHKLNPHRAYPVEVIRQLGTSNGHASQVNRAIEAAIARTIQDLERGYCTV